MCMWLMHAVLVELWSCFPLNSDIEMSVVHVGDVTDGVSSKELDRSHVGNLVHLDHSVCSFIYW